MKVKIGTDDGSRLRKDVLDRLLIMMNRHTEDGAHIKEKGEATTISEREINDFKLLLRHSPFFVQLKQHFNVQNLSALLPLLCIMTTYQLPFP